MAIEASTIQQIQVYALNDTNLSIWSHQWRYQRTYLPKSRLLMKLSCHTPPLAPRLRFEVRSARTGSPQTLLDVETTHVNRNMTGGNHMELLQAYKYLLKRLISLETRGAGRKRGCSTKQVGLSNRVICSEPKTSLDSDSTLKHVRTMEVANKSCVGWQRLWTVHVPGCFGCLRDDGGNWCHLVNACVRRWVDGDCSSCRRESCHLHRLSGSNDLACRCDGWKDEAWPHRSSVGHPQRSYVGPEQSHATSSWMIF